jgi:dTDP-4-amino-4,6-dideoxygalactose transaminase
MHHALPIEEFPDADFLYQNLVLLPIHQSMEEADLQRMVEIVAHVCCHED